jgi:hypothetical protein
MATVALTGKDVVKINDRLLNDLADADCVALTFPNDIAVVKTGKNGNSIYAFKYDGNVCEVVLRVLRGSADDKFLNNLLAVFKNDPAAFTLIQGEFNKQVGDGAGNLTQDTYVLTGGIFKKQTEVKENAEGDTEQAVAIYTLTFSNAPRSIG